MGRRHHHGVDIGRGELGHHHAVGVHPDRNGLQPSRFGGVPLPAPAGVLDRHPTAATIAEHVPEHGERLGGGAADDHVLGVHDHAAHAGQVSGEGVPAVRAGHAAAPPSRRRAGKRGNRPARAAAHSGRHSAPAPAAGPAGGLTPPSRRRGCRSRAGPTGNPRWSAERSCPPPPRGTRSAARPDPGSAAAPIPVAAGRTGWPPAVRPRAGGGARRRPGIPSPGPRPRRYPVPAARHDWPHIYASNWISPQDHLPVRLVGTGRSHGSGADAR